jgi:phosphoglycerate dehydrogenase-like enzyme
MQTNPAFVQEIQRQTPLKDILILHAFCDQLKGILELEFVDLNFHYAENTSQAETLLKSENPQAVFSISHEKLPAKIQRDAGIYPSVKWYHVAGSGIDKMLPWGAENALLTNGAGVLARYLAETVLGAMLALNNHVNRYMHQQHAHQWLGHEFTPLCEQTLLIVGLGAVGERVADNAKALGMRVIATRRSDQGYKNVDQLYPDSDLLKVIAQADFVSLHLPLNEQTKNSFGEVMLKAMKPSACLINTARGGIVDEKALQAALKSGVIKGAYFDVFAEEPLPAESALWQLDNLIITPHMADGIKGYEKHYLRFFGENIKRWLALEPLKNLKRFD